LNFIFFVFLFFVFLFLGPGLDMTVIAVEAKMLLLFTWGDASCTTLCDLTTVLARLLVALLTDHVIQLLTPLLLLW
jgi:hypothetical protein